MEEERVLILAQPGGPIDAAELLQAHAPYLCASCEDLLAALDQGAGTAVLAGDSLTAAGYAALADWVAGQPPWSDLPFVVLGGSLPAADRRLAGLGNLVLLEPPWHPEILRSAVGSALRARRRQYRLREASDSLERIVAERTRDLETARENLEFALAAVDMGSWDLDLATGLIERSGRHDQIFGYPETQPVWSVEHLLQHIAPSERARIGKAFETAAAAGVFECECAITGADGASRWISKKGRVRYAADGRPLRIVGVVADVTARREADAELAQAQKMDALGHLTGGVAHDFNNLLTPIIGNLDLMRRRHRDDATTQRYINGAQRAAERAATLTHRLLTFARRQSLQPRAVDIRALLEGIIDMIRRSLGPVIEITLAFSDQLPAAWVDPNQLELVLLNLAINARDAMADGGCLAISVEAPSEASIQPGLAAGEYICIRAADTGIGMDPATLARATEPFFSTKGVGRGTGLGLSIAHGLAAQSGGALQITSHPGTGTTVELWLPVAQEAAATATLPATELVAAARPAKLLLVDDEEIVRTATADMLRDLGYRVQEAASAAQALAALRSDNTIELLVTDHLMPGTSGGALIAGLRAEGHLIPALLVTGYAPAGSDVPADVPRLAKPFRQVDLAAKVDELLNTAARGPGAEWISG